MIKDCTEYALAFGSRLNKNVRIAVAAGAMLALAALAGGCRQSGVEVLRSDPEFDKAIQTDRPVLMDFYKVGCPSCQAFEPVLAALAKEYQGRVVFSKFELVKSGFVIASPRLQSHYEIDAYPTVLLLVKGMEIHRWVQNLELDSYRKELDQALKGAPATMPATSQAAVTQPAGKP